MRLETPSQFKAKALACLPAQWRRRVGLEHWKKIQAGRKPLQPWAGYREANLWLAGVIDRAAAIRIPLDASDAELCELAEKNAREAIDLGQSGYVMTMEAMRGRLEKFVRGWGIEPPEALRQTKRGGIVGYDDGPAIARMTCPQWWRRKLRRSQCRMVEAEAIRLGYVHRGREVYASDVTVERRAQQRARNRATLEATEAVNMDTGEVYALSDLAAKSVANPRIRRGELMVRIRGFEEVATGLGHVAEFWTSTCPSRMHPKKTGEGGKVINNPKYDGTTPPQAQKYLTRKWANFRAAAWRRGLRFYGFRIAEPHHDATPHWHLLLFMAPWLDAVRRTVPRLRALFRRYFLEDSKEEEGAKRYRCEFKAIEPGKGTAAGYVAKYVAKNIDGGGYEVQGDIETGADSIVPSARVEAWAAAAGIRQFQQVGGPPVGVWRELRRVDAGEGHSLPLSLSRSAADVGNWRAFVEAMGGPVVCRKDLPVRVAYTRPGERWDFQKGEPFPANLNRYGEKGKGVVFGVHDVGPGRAYASRRYRWEIGRGGNASGDKPERRKAEPVLCKVVQPDSCADFLPGYVWSGGFLRVSGRGGHGSNCGGVGAVASGRAMVGVCALAGQFSVGVRPVESGDLRVSGTAKPAPWTRVNNCSGGGFNEWFSDSGDSGQSGQGGRCSRGGESASKAGSAGGGGADSGKCRDFGGRLGKGQGAAGEGKPDSHGHGRAGAGGIEKASGGGA